MPKNQSKPQSKPKDLDFVKLIQVLILIALVLYIVGLVSVLSRMVL